MPTRGLSLVGFIADQQQAVNHLSTACVPSNPNPAALVAEWNSAKAAIGTPFPQGGVPVIQPLPAAQQAHAQQILSHAVFSTQWQGATIALVEIDPILAFQITIDNERSEHHGGTLSNPPTIDELMNLCLPLAPSNEAFTVFPGQNSLVLKARSLNVRQLQGLWNQNFMGIQFGVGIPWVHVVRVGGRCHLYNGYHRSLCIRAAGTTIMPCIVRDVADYKDVGMTPPDFFPPTLLVSNNAPTLGHFTQGRARDVSLRNHSRIIHISWAEHALPDE